MKYLKLKRSLERKARDNNDVSVGRDLLSDFSYTCVSIATSALTGGVCHV